MSSEKIQILLLGDELGLAESIKEAFEKEGHAVYPTTRIEDAFEVLAKQKIEFIFVDCMLQGSTNGVDFVVQVRGKAPNAKFKFILMSGIFIDREFQKDALEKTGAIGFVEKKAPFQVAEVLKYLPKADAGGSAGPAPRKMLYQIFSKEKVSNREKRKIIESLEEVSGFDLPFIYSLLVETRSSGFLNIYGRDGEVSGITISQGHIVGVDVEDKTTYLGEMLIQSGYARPEHVQQALEEKSNQKLGNRLIRGNLISPHAFDLILMEQMNVRLSRTISDQMIRVNFASTEIEKTAPNIDAEQLQFYLHDWIASKITVSWLKSLYVMWGGNPIQFAPGFRDDNPAITVGLVRALPDLLKRIQEGVNLNQLLSDKRYPEAAVYKAVHFLLTKGLIVFGARSSFKSDAEQQASLRKLWADIQGKSPFEISDMLGAENLHGENLVTLLGPEPQDPAGATATLWTNLKNKLEESSRKSSDNDSREKFLSNNAQKESENRIRVAQKMDEAKQALGLNQFAKAHEALLEVQKLSPQADQLHLHMAWAKIGILDPAKKAAGLKEIEFELVQVSAEERYDAHYSLVLGLLHKAKGDLKGARKNFEKAIAMNSSLIVARRELASLDTANKQDGDIFGRVAGLFRRK